MTDESKLQAAPSMAQVVRQRDEARQQAEAEEAQQLLEQLNEEEETEEAETLEETVAPTSDADARKAHEEAEAKRKQEWEAKKQARDDEVQFAWEQAVDLPEDALTAASVKRLGDMTERITRRNMKLCVTESIQTLCYEDLAFARLVMHPRKSMMNCFKYINRKAMEYLKEEMEANGETTKGISSLGGDVPDELCYQWAEEYFRDLNAPEDMTEADKAFVPKAYTGKGSTASKKKPAKKQEKKPAPKAPPKPAEPPVTQTPPADDEPEQIALF